MRARLAAVPLLAVVCLAIAWTPQQEEAHAAPVLEFLQQHCIECHGSSEPAGELALIGIVDGSHALDDVATWRRVRDELRAGRMPPKKRARPDPAEQRAALRWIDECIAEHAAPIDPGRVTLRRLNAREYANTVRDLVGVRFDAASSFPTDDVGHGFDDIGDVLSMSAILFEKYADAAERIARAAIVIADPDHPEVRRLANDKLVGSQGIAFRDGAWSLHRSGNVSGEIVFESDGEYVLRARAWAQQAGPDVARMEFQLGADKVERYDVLATAEASQTYEHRVRVAAGTQRFVVAFDNDFYDPDNPDPTKRDRNLYVEWLEVAGPIGGCASSEFQRRFVTPDASPRDLVRTLASRAWRRPVSDEDVERLLALSDANAPRELVLRNALEALLASPRFLFMLEVDPRDAGAGSVRNLDDFELATRLSYFLWSSLPDDTLFELATSGRLGDALELERQARRMLRDPRSRALVDGFAAQWLQLGTLERASPDLKRFEEFDEELRAAMRGETELLFETVLREDRPVRELLDPDFTFVNARLARHYGFEGVDSPLMQRVRLDGVAREKRGGLLAQASVLTVTSNPTRTSPVKRGKWILDNVLGTPPPPPLPGVDSLDESPQAARAASLRDRLAQHRADEKCAVCHERMDSLGFALEGFDPIGRERQSADGFPIDASGEFDGESFTGVGDLKRTLAGKREFARAVAKKLATYALGRGLRESDEPAIDALLDQVPEEPTLVDLILAVLRMEAFRRRVVAG